MTRGPSDACVELLTFLSWPGIGVARARALLRSLPQGRSILEFARASYAERAPKVAEAASPESYAVAQLLEQCADLGVEILCMSDREYPALLREIPDAPPVLYVLGSVSVLGGRAVAVVGTRHASDVGRKAAHDVSVHLAQAGIHVVSGLALGIDGAAHEGALHASGTTIAVLAHGLDTVSPASHRKLAQRIVETGGALVSEHPPGTPPRPPEFARRNRIQSGLSVASVMVESGAEGGAMIQAKFTREQGRALLAVFSQSPEHNRAGSERLVSEFNATPLRTLRDLDTALRDTTSRPAPHDEGGVRQMGLEF